MNLPSICVCYIYLSGYLILNLILMFKILSEESIPVMQHDVKNAVTKEMKEWLFKYVIIISIAISVSR